MRRLLVLICLLSLIAFSGGAEVYAVNYTGGALVVNDVGETVLPPGRYQRIQILRSDDGQVTGYAAGNYMEGILKYALLSPEGEALSDCILTGLWAAGDGFFAVKDNVFHYVYPSLEVDGTAYSSLTYSGNGKLLSLTGSVFDDVSDPVGILDSSGFVFDTGIYTLGSLGQYCEGLLALLDATSNLYGYLDTDGAWVIAPAYRYAGDFQDGLAIVAGAMGYGVIDKTGASLLPAEYDLILRGDGLFAAVRENALYLMNADLSQTACVPLESANAALAGKYALLSSASSTRLLSVSGEALASWDGLVTVSGAGGDALILERDGAYQLITPAGDALSQEWDLIYPTGGDLLAYGSRGDTGMKFGLMDRAGQEVTPALYDAINWVAQGLYCGDISGGAVLLSAEGEVLNTYSAREEGLSQ